MADIQDRNQYTLRKEKNVQAVEMSDVSPTSPFMSKWGKE